MRPWLVLSLCVGVGSAAPPLPVDDLQIQLLGSGHVRLSWSPITQDSLGNPLDCIRYEIHRSQIPHFMPSGTTWIDSTTVTELVLPTPDELSFYRVVVHSCAAESPFDPVFVPAGQFMMGQVGVATPEHSVTLTHGFMLGRQEVTNAQYLEALNWAQAQGLVVVVGEYVKRYSASLPLENLLHIQEAARDRYEIRYNPDTQQFYLHAATWIDAWGGQVYGPGEAYPGGSYDPANHPVKHVSWYGAACYCDWRSQMENLPPYYQGLWNQIPNPRNPYLAQGYRLPTEAEWEFAAQHDDERIYPWGPAEPTCDLANGDFDGFCVGWTSPVGVHPAGASLLGLQDMAGNVWEWCNDWWNGYSSSSVTDPTGPSTGTYRILRGGSWYDTASYLRSVHRARITPLYTQDDLGFRLARTLE